MANFAWTLTGARSATGTGAAADTFGAGDTDGMNLDAVGGFGVYVEADETRTISTAFALKAYAKNPITGRWSRAPGWDLAGSITGDRGEYLGGFEVVSPAGRVAYVPSAGAVSAGNVSIQIVATGVKGEAL
jgi:hypothetical protein